jgi:hypothetical protein
MAWLALAMKPHWAQVQSTKPHTAAVARRLRVAGAVALLLSLAASLGADHPSMALLVWVMTLSVSAVIVAMALAYWPKCFIWLSWLPDGSGEPRSSPPPERSTRATARAMSAMRRSTP